MPATVAYNANTGVATLTPSSALLYGTTYTARVKGGGSGVKDVSGNALVSDHAWTFTAEPPPPPVLVLGASANPFSTYASQILLAEGLNAFKTADVGADHSGVPRLLRRHRPR